MTAIVTAEFSILDAERLQEYASKATPTIARFGGELLINGPMTTVAGDSLFSHKVILTFPNREQAESWYRSPEYQALIPIREQAIDANIAIVAG